MRNIKKIGKVFIIVLVSLLIVNYIRLNVTYMVYKSSFKRGFPIYGNTNNYVPQGLVYSSKYDIVLQTSYNAKHKVSMLYVINFKTGKLLKSLKLKEIDSSDNVNHVGGITTDNNTVWITNDYEVNEYSLDEVYSTDKDYIQSLKNTKLPVRGDFCYYNDNSLWIGDFCLSPFYKVPDNTPLVFKYDVDNIDYNKPNLIISIPKMVQGMIIVDDTFIFTRSFTNLINSDLSYYENVLNGKSDTYKLKGRRIPYYHFKKDNLIKNVKLPPMAEGLFSYENDLYISFENSSDHYFYAYPKNKNVIIYSNKNTH